MMTYTQEEMLAIWRTRLGFDELRTDCTVERYDGLDVNAGILAAMRAWYLNLLSTAPAQLLPVRQFSPATSAAGSSLLRLVPPPECRRVLEVSSPRWACPAEPQSRRDVAGLLAGLSSPYAEAAPGLPVAAVCGDGSLLAAPLDEDSAVTLTGVADPGPDTYILDPSLLSSIPTDYSLL